MINKVRNFGLSLRKKVNDLTKLNPFLRKFLNVAVLAMFSLIFISVCLSAFTFVSYIFMLLWNYALVGTFSQIPSLDLYRSMGLLFFLSIISMFFKK